jgi:hypothetical protein
VGYNVGRKSPEKGPSRKYVKGRKITKRDRSKREKKEKGSNLDGKVGCATGALHCGLDEMPSLSNVNLATFEGMLYTPGAFKPRESLTGQKKLETFLRERPTVLMLCSDSTLLV